MHVHIISVDHSIFFDNRHIQRKYHSFVSISAGLLSTCHIDSYMFIFSFVFLCAETFCIMSTVSEEKEEEEKTSSLMYTFYGNNIAFYGIILYFSLQPFPRHSAISAHAILQYNIEAKWKK